MLYLENYEEMRNLVFTSKKIVILTPKNIFWKTDSYNFPGKNNGSGHCVVTAKCSTGPYQTPISKISKHTLATTANQANQAILTAH